MKDLIYLSATKAKELFTTKKLSPVELLQAIIEQSKIVEPNKNAFSEQLFDEALIQSKEGKKYIWINRLHHAH